MTTTNPKRAQLSPAKRALIELKQMRLKLDELTRAKTEPIAIIGMGCRYPGGVKDLDSYWNLLSNGIDAISEVPGDRWDVDKLYDPDPDKPGKMSTRYGGFLEDIDRFDADFFSISTREALSMDPQQRLLMEVCWEALENAGQASADLLESKTGIFVGISSFDYAQLISSQVNSEDIDAYLGTGVSHSAASGRLSYFLGLQGPCLSIDTACSSSLVGLHYACQSLRNGECRMALSGGVNLILIPTIHLTLSKARLMAPDGRCKVFDAAADGFVRSEGCGIIVLKRLSDAIADNDHILSVIRGSAINQDGRSSGLTAPNGPSQQAVLREALQNAGVKPDQVQYVEVHGTGTALGDPIEVQALAEVYAQDRAKSDPLYIGSVKTNIGHTESAAGVAGLMKTVLALQHKRIPPHLHLKKLNPLIEWENYPVKVAKSGIEWRTKHEPRLAGISSFGFTGTNAHIILEEAPAPKETFDHPERPLHILTFSAPTEKAHMDLGVRYADNLEADRPERLADICYTANTGRTHFGNRSAMIVKSKEDAAQALRKFGAGQDRQGLKRGKPENSEKPETVFLFTGQGAQYANMCKRLFETQPTFHKVLENCDDILQSLIGRSMMPFLFPDHGENTALDETEYTQPVVFAVGYALAELWKSWGIRPDAVIGHSLGEYVAACVAGVFGLEDGLKLVTERARLIQSLPPDGTMAAVFGNVDNIQTAIQPHTDVMAISAINDPMSAVISGETNAVRDLLSKLKDDGIHSKFLKVSHAFHSPLMEPILKRFGEVVDEIKMMPPRIKFVSNVTGDLFPMDFEFTSTYWKRHLRETVQFSSGIQVLYNEGYRTFIEIGPHPVLCAFGRAHLPDETVGWLPSLRRDGDEWSQILDSLAELYVRGGTVDWDAFDKDYCRRKVFLPTYPFQRERHWLKTAAKPNDIRMKDSGAVDVWDAVIDSGVRLTRQLSEKDLKQIKTGLDAMDQLALGYIKKAFIAQHLFGQADETHVLSSILKRLNVLSIYTPLVHRWLDYLCSAGELKKENDAYTSTNGLSSGDIDQIIHEAQHQLDDIPLLGEYIKRSGEDIGNILAGSTNPVEILFPSGSLETSIEIHQKWPLSSYYNKIIGGLTSSIVDATPSQEALRIVEIGAGIGGLTSEILPLLPDQKMEYWYTDVSDFFLNAGRQRFSQFPFVQFACLDIESPPLEQGLGAHGFDIVIADNVLHPAGDITKAIDHMISLMKPGGILILRETTQQMLWRVVSFGPLEVSSEQKISPGIIDGDFGVHDWSNILSEKEFVKTEYFPKDGTPSAILPQHVMIAQAPRNYAEMEYIAPTIKKENRPVDHHASDLEENPNRSQGVKDTFIELLMETPEIGRVDTLVGFVREHIMKTLGRDDSKPIPRDRRLMDMGVDSLMAVEFRNRLKKGLGLEEDLPATLIFDFPTIETIASYLFEQVLVLDSGNPNSDMTDDIPDDIEASPSLSDNQIEDISEEEMERLLIEKLDRMGTGN